MNLVDIIEAVAILVTGAVVGAVIAWFAMFRRLPDDMTKTQCDWLRFRARHAARQAHAEIESRVQHQTLVIGPILEDALHKRIRKSLGV
jgi:hypothetical protein